MTRKARKGKVRHAFPTLKSRFHFNQLSAVFVDKMRTPKARVLKKRPSKDALQNFFLQEIENGERCFVLGDLESSVEHFVNAVVVCEEPGRLLLVFKQTLPNKLYQSVKCEIRRISVE